MSRPKPTTAQPIGIHSWRQLVRAGLVAALTLQAMAASALEQDPTLPPQVSAAPAADNNDAAKAAPKLQAIICARHSCSAIVNGKAVKAGEEFNGKKIERIEPRQVVLTQNGEQTTLRLVEPLTRQEEAK